MKFLEEPINCLGCKVVSKKQEVSRDTRNDSKSIIRLNVTSSSKFEFIANEEMRTVLDSAIT
jgi:hypothetical protein